MVKSGNASVLEDSRFAAEGSWLNCFGLTVIAIAIAIVV